MLRVGLQRRDDYPRSDVLWGVFLFHQLQNLSPKCEQTRSPVTQDGCKTTVQSSYKLITGENYDDWVKSFPKKVKVDQHLGRFRRMSRWILHLSAFCDESQGLQSSVKLLSTTYWGWLPLWEKWNPLRYYVSNILSTSVKITPTNSAWSALDTGESALQLIRFLHQLMISWSVHCFKQSAFILPVILWITLM